MCACVRLLDAAVRLLDVRRLDVRLRMLDAAVRLGSSLGILNTQRFVRLSRIVLHSCGRPIICLPILPLISTHLCVLGFVDSLQADRTFRAGKC